MEYLVVCLAQTASPMASNVQRFPKAREPTVRAAEGFPPPFPSIHFHRLRWQGAKRRRGKRVLGAVGSSGCPRPLHAGRRNQFVLCPVGLAPGQPITNDMLDVILIAPQAQHKRPTNLHDGEATRRGYAAHDFA